MPHRNSASASTPPRHAVEPFHNPISPEKFRDIAGATPGRTILLLRHAERPSIAEDDPTFGQHLGLTPAGEQDALALGRRLHGIEPCAFAASPMRRTKETARFVAKGMARHDAAVQDAPEVGLGGLWVTDLAETHRQYEIEGAGPATDRYLRDGHFNGYHSVADGTRLMTDWILNADFGARHAIVFSHDTFIAAYLQGLGVRKFNSANWIGYLQGAALVQDAAGAWSAHYCVPDPRDFANVFIQ
ncbi:MAG: histidine phosphatase family protein [Kiritimatiellia bacterium]|jgi:broad specificity phosphatase PhoE